MSLKVMDKITEETLTPLEANNVSLKVLHKISNEAPLKDFLQQFLFPSVPNEVFKSQAEVLHQLSGEYQIESVLPWRSFDMIKTICNKPDHKDDCTKELIEMRRYNTQILDLIALSVKNTCTQVLALFFRYLIEKVESIHYGNGGVHLVTLDRICDAFQMIFWIFTSDVIWDGTSDAFQIFELETKKKN